MRTLTFKREKTFVGSAGKLNVYIEDPIGETEIQGRNCHFLGKVKNGETAQFQIGDGAARLYVIADQLSKTICCDFYQIPEGSEDVAVSGKCKFNPATGNAFRFNGNEGNAEAMLERKKSGKKGLVVLIVAILIGLAIGFLFSFFVCRPGGCTCTAKIVKNGPKTFKKGGFSIVLNERFTETTIEPYDLAAVSSLDRTAMAVLEEPFNLMIGLGDKTIDEYAKIVAANNGYGASTLKSAGDARYIEYEVVSTEDNVLYHYWVYMFKGKSSFWIVNFSAPAKRAAKMAPSVAEWANSVTLS